MVTRLRVLDDGAWVSVDDERRVPNSDVWPLAVTAFCECETAHVVVEAFLDVGVSEGRVEVEAVGQCIDCGEDGHLSGLAVGRVVDGGFEPYAPSRVQATLEPGWQASPVPGSRGEN